MLWLVLSCDECVMVMQRMVDARRKIRTNMHTMHFAEISLLMSELNSFEKSLHDDAYQEAAGECS